MILLELDYMLLQHEPQLHFIRIQWQSGHSLRQLKSGLEHVLHFIQAHSVTHMVLDLHHLPDIGVVEQNWISQIWLPKALSQALTHVALVLPSKSLYNQMVVESVLWVGHPLIKADIQFFPDIDTALDWATEQSPLLPNLEREWLLAYSRRPVTE